MKPWLVRHCDNPNESYWAVISCATIYLPLSWFTSRRRRPTSVISVSFSVPEKDEKRVSCVQCFFATTRPTRVDETFPSCLRILFRELTDPFRIRVLVLHSDWLYLNWPITIGTPRNIFGTHLSRHFRCISRRSSSRSLNKKITCN